MVFTVDIVVHHFDIGIRCISLECTLSFKQNDKPCLEDQTVLRPNQSGTPLCFFKYIKRERTSLQKNYIDKFLQSHRQVTNTILRPSYKNISKYILWPFYFSDQGKRKYSVMTTYISERSITWNK